MSYAPANVVEVVAWGETVGAVALDPTTGVGVLEYTPQWRRGNRELSPVLAPLTAARVTGSTRALDTFHGLPPLLADVLPDDFGNAIIDAYLTREGIDRTSFTPLDRLVYAGNRAMGALEFRPPSPQPAPPTALNLSRLVGEARAAIRGDLAKEPTAAVVTLFSVGTSAGGARAKAVVAISDAGEIRSGSLPPEPGWTDYVMKFDGAGSDTGESEGYTRIEYAYHLMARAAGIVVPPARLLEEGGRAHFLSQRFDRQAGERVHMQSLCALRALDFRLRDAHDYAQLFETVDLLGLPPETRTEILRRAAFNVFAFNRDDHTKNHAFLMDRTGQWSLAPAFDLTFAYSPSSYWNSRHLMGVDGEFTAPGRPDLERIGDIWGVPGINATLNQVADAVATWPDFARQAGVETERARVISEVLTSGPHSVSV
jgi:serine/threonine-protein kinase HipA